MTDPSKSQLHHSESECTCAMTEGSMLACEVHGLDGDEEKLAQWEHQIQAAALAVQQQIADLEAMWALPALDPSEGLR